MSDNSSKGINPAHLFLMAFCIFLGAFGMYLYLGGTSHDSLLAKAAGPVDVDKGNISFDTALDTALMESNEAGLQEDDTQVSLEPELNYDELSPDTRLDSNSQSIIYLMEQLTELKERVIHVEENCAQ